MKIEVSHGEILDKASILLIKEENFSSSPDKLSIVKKELKVLEESVEQILTVCPDAVQLFQELYDINLELWKIEDDIRDCEREKDFSDKFIELARSVYITNDKRAAIKKQINDLSGSEISEVKGYKEYSDV